MKAWESGCCRRDSARPSLIRRRRRCDGCRSRCRSRNSAAPGKGRPTFIMPFCCNTRYSSSGILPTRASLLSTSMLEKYSANPSSNHGSTLAVSTPFINWWAYSWKTTLHGFSTDMSSMMKLRSSAPCKLTRQLHRLSVPQRRELLHFLVIAEGHNLQRDGNIHAGPGHQDIEHGPHLLEAHGGFPPALFSRIGHHGKMRRLDFNPLRIAGEHDRDRAQGEQQQKDRTGIPSKRESARTKTPDG